MTREQKIRLIVGIQSGLIPLGSLKPKYDYHYIKNSLGLYKCQQTNETLTYLEVKKAVEFCEVMEVNIIKNEIDNRSIVYPIMILTIKNNLHD